MPAYIGRYSTGDVEAIEPAALESMLDKIIAVLDLPDTTRTNVRPRVAQALPRPEIAMKHWDWIYETVMEHAAFSRAGWYARNAYRIAEMFGWR